MLWLFVFLLTNREFCVTIGEETNRLNYFETLSHVHVSSIVKRSSTTKSELVKELQFYAFQRNFHLTLKFGSPVVPNNFRARIQHKDGTSSYFPIDHSKIFTGHNTYNAQSKVFAHIEENSLWSIHMFEENETYAVEPAWRILSPSENQLNDTMVAYRLSDIKGIGNRQVFCKKPDKEPTTSNLDKTKDFAWNYSQYSYPTYAVYGDRHKRNIRPHIIKRNTCQMYLVGDTDFLLRRCNGNHFSCSQTMITYLQTADHIYRNSPFEDQLGNVIMGIGLQVAELVLLPHHSSSTHGQMKHFNEQFDNWNADLKLTSFATAMKMTGKRYCLNHLFTEFPDPDGVLGLAYVSQLCSWGSVQRYGEMYNSGITSGTNKAGLLFPSLATSIVLTHEVGHNFGSNHDPVTAECAPDDNNGGKFLMWTFAVSGLNPNNKKFSKCSLRQIGRLLPGTCFRERSDVQSFCGNGIVDPGEECDAGFYGIKNEDKCCSSICSLRPGAVCSEVNHECCQHCQYAPEGTICYNMNRTFSCLKNSFCVGKTVPVCKEGGYMPDGADCGEKHICHQGQCISPCKQETIRQGNIKLEPCLCTHNATEGCKWCCFDATDPENPGECQPVLDEPRRDGTNCYKGMCQRGACIPTIRQDKTRLEAYIQFVYTSTLRQFLRANIVLVVIVLSLVLWTPAVLWVHSQDMESRKMRDLIWDAIVKQAMGEDIGKDIYDSDDDDDDDDYEYIWPRKSTVYDIRSKQNKKSLTTPMKGHVESSSLESYTTGTGSTPDEERESSTDQLSQRKSETYTSTTKVQPKPLKSMFKRSGSVHPKESSIKTLSPTTKDDPKRRGARDLTSPV